MKEEIEKRSMKGLTNFFSDLSGDGKSWNELMLKNVCFDCCNVRALAVRKSQKTERNRWKKLLQKSHKNAGKAIGKPTEKPSAENPKGT